MTADLKNKGEILIRPFSFPEDYEIIYKLWLNAGDGIHLRFSDEPGEIEKKIARDPDLFLLAEMDGEVLGTVMGGFDGRRTRVDVSFGRCPGISPQGNCKSSCGCA